VGRRDRLLPAPAQVALGVGVHTHPLGLGERLPTSQTMNLANTAGISSLSSAPW
jgi:hypothetical protein